MGRTVADFGCDAGLYFRDAMVLDDITGYVVHLEAFEDDHEAVVRCPTRPYTIATEFASEVKVINTEYLRQWWPRSGVYNVRFGPQVFGLYVGRRSRRQTRRSTCSSSVHIFSPSRRLVYDLAIANAMESPILELNTCEALAKWWPDKQVDVVSLALGRSLLWTVKDGLVHYRDLGVVGRLAAESWEFKPIGRASQLYKRARGSIAAFMEGEGNAN